MAERLALKGEYVGLEFEEEDRSRWVGLLFLPTGRNWLGDQPQTLWRIGLKRGDDDVEVEGDPSKVQLSYQERLRGIRVQLEWPEVFLAPKEKPLKVTVTAFIAHSDPSIEWSLQIQNPTQWGLTGIEFPRLHLEASSEAEAIVPWGWGRRLKGADLNYTGRYPSHNAVLQMFCLLDGEEGLYLAIKDRSAAMKDFLIRPKEKGVWVSIHHFPAPWGKPQESFSLPYAIQLSPFRGSWERMAKEYRKWVLSAPWMREGPMMIRKTTPPWIKEIPLWCQVSGRPEEIKEPVKAFARYFEVPIAVHWYNWHQIPFDDHYPEFLPPKEGFAEVVKELQEAGIRVMPYINGRIVDARTETYKRENLEASIARNPEGKPYIETYGSGVPLTVMCPATSYWQNKVAEIVEALASQYGVDAVYIDQIASAPARLCVEEGHSHPPGGGSVWTEGYRKMLTLIRQRLSKGKSLALTTEDAAEPWSDLFDAFLQCNSTMGGLEPLYPLVYSGYNLTFGRYFFSEDFQKAGNFEAKAGQMFIWGAQMGWLSPEVLQHPQQAAYLKTLAQARWAGLKYLAYGEMLPTPCLLREGIPQKEVEWTLFGRTYRFSLPVVLASVWRSQEDHLGIVLTNWSEKPQTVFWHLRPREHLRRPYSSWRRISLYPQQESSTTVPYRAVLEEEMTLPPLSAFILEFQGVSP